MLTINDVQYLASLLVLGIAVDADRDNPSGTSYFGYLRPDGSWRIMCQVNTDGVTAWRFCKGDGKTSGSYADNWSTHATRTDYDYPL